MKCWQSAHLPVWGCWVCRWYTIN